ncbi:hypothetical protein [Desulfomarina sp.]
MKKQTSTKRPAIIRCSDKPAWPDSMARTQQGNKNPNCGDTLFSHGFPLKKNLYYILPFLLILLTSLPVQAHKVRIFAWEEGGMIKTEAKFSGGKPARNSTVTVTSQNGKVEILKGKTDEGGTFSFPVPKKARDNRLNLKITINSGDGHKNSWLLKAEDYLPGVKSTPQKTNTITEIVPEQKSARGKELPNEALLREIISSELDRQLGPIKRSLAIQQEKPTSLQDILGGIGYILGLAGIATYFQAKRKGEKKSS